MRVGIERFLRRLLPFDRERGAAFQGGPGRLADDSNSTRARDEAHSANRERFRILRTFRLRPAPGRSFDRGVEHLRDLCVDAITRRAGHDGASIDALGRLSDQVEIARLLQRRIGWDRKLRGVGDQLSVFETAFARGVDDLALCRGAGRAIDFPSRRSRGDEHLASSGASLPQHFPTGRDTGAAASSELLELRARRGLHQLDARPIGFELIGQDHRERSANALTHLRFSDGQRHGPVGLRRGPIHSV